MNYSKNASTHMGTSKANLSPASGATNNVPSSFPSWWTTSASNTPGVNMRITSEPFSKSTTRSPLIGLVHDTSASLSIGTTPNVHLSMPGYVTKALKQFHHPKPVIPQHTPFPSTPIKYGAKKQYAKLPSTSPALNKTDKRFIQQVCGKFLFLGRSVDPTLLCPISVIASQSAQPTKDTMKQTHQLLDYLASQEDAVLTYNASDMILGVHSDASYLSEPNARSRASGHFFLSNNAAVPPNNGAILNIAHIIKHIMASATEAKLGALYITAHEAVFLRIILEELGHRQPATPIQTDTVMAEGVINGKVQPKRTKAMDMRFHWLSDRECQEQFCIYWRPVYQPSLIVLALKPIDKASRLAQYDY
eukprot:CCRYP_015259-RA/>CCRYP_015259-RA protein AED:0.43 eAED:0.43 QI:0/0/0/0.66/0.5/0.33/3/0/361